MKRNDPEKLGDFINKMIKEYGLEEPMASNKACWLWGEVTGQGINGLTTRRMVKDGQLHVWISSAPLKNELLFQREKIMQAINAELGDRPISGIVIH